MAYWKWLWLFRFVEIEHMYRKIKNRFVKVGYLIMNKSIPLCFLMEDE